jgi:hypothetical protein
MAWSARSAGSDGVFHGHSNAFASMTGGRVRTVNDWTMPNPQSDADDEIAHQPVGSRPNCLYDIPFQLGRAIVEPQCDYPRRAGTGSLQAMSSHKD